jgi:hypothetical protein
MRASSRRSTEAATVYGGKGVAALTAEGNRQLERFARDGGTDHVPGASASDQRAAMYWPDEGFLDYYLNARRGGIRSGGIASRSSPGRGGSPSTRSPARRGCASRR